MLSKEEIEKAKEICEDLIELLKKDTLNINKIFNLIKEGEAIETFLQYIDQLEFQIQAKEKVHDYDVNMIDEVKGEIVKLYKENNKLNKIINEIINYIAGLDIEDICEEIGKVDCDKMDFGECESCLRKYFEKKIEEE